MFKIHNFRAGFATNSSSSHSVVLLPPGTKGVYERPESWTGNYGWDDFVLVSEESKLRYLAAQLMTNYITSRTERDPAVIDFFAREMPDIFEELINYDSDQAEEKWYSPPLTVDHQSVISFPTTFNEEFATGMLKFFKSKRVVVFGGNDNSDGNPHLVGEPVKFLTDRHGPMKFLSDGDFWTVFSVDEGNKVRFSLSEGEVGDYTKSSVPELVDLKITDYCGAGCNFCYQSSTKEGKHAPFHKLVPIIDMLAELGTFEIAIGGGEPTDHPAFIEILRYIRGKDMVPNFTTFSDRWLNNPNMVQVVAETVGGIGVSVHDPKGLALVEAVRGAVKGKGSHWNRPEVMAQHVVGAVPVLVTAEFINKAREKHFPILLLGYKDVGFGKNYRRHDKDVDVSTILKLAITDRQSWATVSVDTALVDQYPEFIDAIGAPRALVTSPEGKFSCYIDGVEGLVGPSSYVQKSKMHNLDTNLNAFKKLYATF